MVHKADLLDILEPHNLPEEYGGTWKYDARKDWLEPYLERYRPKGPANAWKWSYYCPSTLLKLANQKKKKREREREKRAIGMWLNNFEELKIIVLS